tara:strand:- start:30697 stop:30990 length:294 start_codon:yes stop_codon:yes gene_type:complete
MSEKMNSGPRLTVFRKGRKPKRSQKKSKKVWIGAQSLFGHLPASMTMIPSNSKYNDELLETTRWVIEKIDDDPNPIIIDAPATKAYDMLIAMLRENQ